MRPSLHATVLAAIGLMTSCGPDSADSGPTWGSCFTPDAETESCDSYCEQVDGFCAGDCDPAEIIDAPWTSRGTAVAATYQVAWEHAANLERTGTAKPEPGDTACENLSIADTEVVWEANPHASKGGLDSLCATSRSGGYYPIRCCCAL